MTLDGIPEKLPRVAETVEHPHSVAADARLRGRRRMTAASSNASDDARGGSAAESDDQHVLDDLA